MQQHLGGYEEEHEDPVGLVGDDRLELTVQRLEDGEVSPYLTDVLMPGYPLELRGPIGGWFVWDPDASGPVLLVAGGSGVVPAARFPRELAIAPGGEAALVTNFGSGQLQVVALGRLP